MIVTKLMGGLGNQMFQYAFARYLAIKNNSNAILDLDYINKRPHNADYTFRTYELHIFNIDAKTTDNYFKDSFIHKVKNKLINLKYQFEPSKFEVGMLMLKGNIYLNGFWQSEKYFQDIHKTIRKDFTFKNELSIENKRILSQINKVNSISIHIRRGDYVNNPIAAKIHGVCSASYYDKAIKEIQRQVENPVFFIFSDDIGWTKKNIKINSQHCFIDNNKGFQSFNDMLLMSNCKHNIIANSSFSWWAAWLNMNPKKAVIAPQKWFSKEDDMNLDLIPQKWIRL